MNETLIQEIKRFLVTDLFVELPEEKIDIDSGLHGDLGLDSLAFAELRFWCEERFKVEISQAAMNSGGFRSVRSVVELIEELTVGVDSDAADEDAP